MSDIEEQPLADLDEREYRLFRSLDTHNEGTISVGRLLDSLRSIGLSETDARLRETMDALSGLGLRDRLSAQRFCDLIRSNILLIERALAFEIR